MVSHFQAKNSQNVAPLTEIVAFFEKKIWGAFWRFPDQKRALPDSKHLATLFISEKLMPKLLIFHSADFSIFLKPF